MSPFNDGRRGFICFLFNLWKHSGKRNWKWNHFIIQNQQTIESDLWVAVIVISSAVSFPVLFFKQCLWYVNKLQANEEQMKAKSYLCDPSRSATHFVCKRYARKVCVLCRRCNNQPSTGLKVSHSAGKPAVSLWSPYTWVRVSIFPFLSLFGNDATLTL